MIDVGQMGQSMNKSIMHLLSLKRIYKQGELLNQVVHNTIKMNIHLEELKKLHNPESQQFITIFINKDPALQNQNILKNAVIAAALMPIAIDSLEVDISDILPLRSVIIQLIYSTEFGSPQSLYYLNSIMSRWSMNESFADHPFVKRIQQLNSCTPRMDKYQRICIPVKYNQKEGLDGPIFLKGSYRSDKKYQDFEQLYSHFDKAKKLVGYER